MRKFILTLSICIYIGTCLCSAQTDKKATKYEQAQKYIANEDYSDALVLLQNLLAQQPNDAYAHYLSGICLIYGTDLDASFSQFEKAYALDKKVSDDIHYQLAKASQLNYQFDQAIKYYRLYIEDLQNKYAHNGGMIRNELLKVTRSILECENAKVYFHRPFDHIILNMGMTINSQYPEYTPIINPNNDLLIYTARRPENNGGKKDKDNKYFEDIWLSRKDPQTGHWSKPQNFGSPINSAQHDACISLSSDGKTMYLYKSINGGDIYFSNQINGTWTEPQPMPKPFNSKFKETSFTISENGKVAYFSSNRPGGFGGLDIYRAEIQPDGTWGEAVNLGSLVNSEFDEDSPFLENDGKVLFFSSNGHNSMGGYDIFSIRYDTKKKTWSTPVNMGYPINSPHDDIYFTIAKDRKTAYFASAKKDGIGEKDIYVILLDTNYEYKSQKIQTIVSAHGHEAIQNKMPALTTHNIHTVNGHVMHTDNTSSRHTSTFTTSGTHTTNHSITSHTEKPKDTKPVETTTTSSSKPIASNSVSTEPSKETKNTPSHSESVTNNSDQAPNKKPLPVKTYDIDDAEDDEIQKTNPNNKLGTTTLKGQITDESKKPIEADVYIKKIHTIEPPKQIRSLPDGTFSIELLDGFDYAIDVEKKGFLFFSDNLDLEKAIGDQIVLENVVLRPPKSGSRIVLKNIFFRRGSAYLNPESKLELEVLLRFLKQHPELKVEISGHTDNTGSHEVNYILSEARAKSVYDYLLSKGVSPNVLQYKGYGEDKPLASNQTEEGRKKNRRTEFEILP